MSEREQKPTRAEADFPLSAPGRGSGGGVNNDPREERLRTLYAAVYPPSYPSVKPSEGLRRRVAAVTASSDARAARRRFWGLSLPIRPLPALGAAAAALVAVVGIALVRRGHEGSKVPSATWRVSRPSPGQTADRPLSASPRRERDPDRRMASMPRVIPPSARHDGPSVGQRSAPLAVSPPAAARASVGDDLGALNGDPVGETRRWIALSPDEWDALEAHVRETVGRRDDFVQIPFPRLAAASGSAQQIAAAIESYQREAAIVDARLAREVAVHQKAIALSDLCERLRSDTGITLIAGQSVADEKVTLFCAKMPLREVMRQLSRPFGYTWLRSGKSGDYRYELTQDLRSQLMEEELRNRDRNAALIALEREIERYRPYLALSPDEALARAKTAKPAEKPLLEKLAGPGWGPIHIYYQLSRSELEALRAGQTFKYASQPLYGEQPLPPSVARGVLQSQRQRRLKVRQLHPGGPSSIGDRDEIFDPTDVNDPEGRPLTDVPEASATVSLSLKQSELGRFTLEGVSGFYAVRRPGLRPADTHAWGDVNPLAVGTSPAVLKPANGAANTTLAEDPTLRARVTLRPQVTCGLTKLAGTGDESPPEPKLTPADVLEALHQATGLPVVSDYYTRLYKPEVVSISNQPLYDALNRLTDTMRLRWDKERDGGWLQFRSTSFYNDRIKEVPNRLLARWFASRRQHGVLTLDDLCEIAQLPDAQLDGAEMTVGARECYGLAEWGLPCDLSLRPHMRYLAGFTPAERQEAMSAAGLPFTRMPLAQQQGFVARALIPEAGPLQSLDELAGAILRVDYSLPGSYEWHVPSSAPFLQWVLPVPPGTRAPRPLVRERTREAALQVAQRISPRVRERIVHAERLLKPDVTEADIAPQPSQIVPTRLDLTVLYIPGASHARLITWTSTAGRNWTATWD
jgi:hypothetical protein